MSLVKAASDGSFHFWCIGCECYHGFNNTWKFNGNYKKPTVEPSLLTQWNEGDKQFKCHIFITDGKLNYLPDCTHKLAGQTVDMVEVKD